MIQTWVLGSGDGAEGLPFIIEMKVEKKFTNRFDGADTTFTLEINIVAEAIFTGESGNTKEFNFVLCKLNSPLKGLTNSNFEILHFTF